MITQNSAFTLLKVRVIALKAAYALIKIYEFLPLPLIPGVVVVLTYEGQVVLVRHSYGEDQWTLPGGLQWRRRPINQAELEIRQELGVKAELRPLATLRSDRRRRLTIFTAELNDFRLKRNPEIAEVGFFLPHELPDGLTDNIYRALRLIGWSV